MRRRKILHVITRLDFGGAQQNTLYTVAHLDPARFEAVLACGPGGELDGEAERLGLRTRFIEDLVREVSPVRDLAALGQLVQLMREEAPDAVHTHSSKAGILGRLAARLAGVPVVVHTHHGFAFHDRMGWPARAAALAAERLAAGWADRLVFVSRANMETARAEGLGDPARFALIRSGVRLADFPARVDREAKRRELGVRLHRPLVCGIGNLKPQKNAGDFLRVAEAVLARVPEASFVYVGDGPQRARLEAFILGRGLTGKVKLLGWRRDAAEILAASDAFVSTALWEGLPRALLEAMRSGLACACYAADGVSDVLVDGANGFCAAPGDCRGLADKVLLLVSDEALRRRLGAAAAASVGPEFDIDGMVRAQERLLEGLFAEAAARRNRC